jgi:hypothetical protein
VLIAAEGVENASVAATRDDLRSAVSVSVDTLRSESRRSVRAETDLSRPAVGAVVDAGFGRWEDPARRALAAGNGSLARAIAAEAAERASGSTPGRADRIETRVETALDDTLGSRAGTVPQHSVDAAADRVREQALSAATDRGRDGVPNETLGSLPAGVPVAPVPGQWYATVNVWNVSVRGAYARFTLRTRRGGPTPGGTVRYVRDGSVVRLDVDDDGEGERLGRDERIDFETRTAVAVAVPPNSGGVGDVGGDRRERAGTWPEPRCTSWRERACPESE